MSTPANPLPERLQEIVSEFAWGEGREKVELLLYYAESLPPLPAELKADPSQMQPVHECMTPVFVHAEVQNGGMRFLFDIPPESPTVRGYAAILATGLDGAAPDEILHIPNDFFLQMGLQDLLTAQRLNGFGAILAHVKRLAAEALPSRALPE